MRAVDLILKKRDGSGTRLERNPDYFKHIRSLDDQAAQNGQIVLKGVEVVPYYFNYGKFPALVVDEDLAAGDLAREIREAGGELLAHRRRPRGAGLRGRGQSRAWCRRAAPHGSASGRGGCRPDRLRPCSRTVHTGGNRA